MFFRLFRGLWRALDFLRRLTLNLIFAVIVFAVIGAFWFASKTPELPQQFVLEIPLRGNLVMAPTALGGGSGVLSKAFGRDAEETVISDVTDALSAAEEDKRVTAVLLRTDDLVSAGPAAASEIGRAIERFQKTGRKVCAWSDDFSQAQWAASAASAEIFVHPSGGVTVKGLEATSLYWGKVLKKLGVTVNVAKAGAYKSAPEAYTAEAPSEDAKEALRFWLNDEWKTLAATLERARGLEPGALGAWTKNYLGNLKAHGGDAAAAASEAGLISGTSTLRELKSRLAGKKCAGGSCGSAFASVEDYLAAADVPRRNGSKTVAVITLEGEITDDARGLSAASPETLVPLIEKAETDKDVVAVVLQVNSPGGSAAASDKIRDALMQLKAAGKPIVAYFGSTAASGGYWVATAADRIVANPLSVTGSIGVFGIMPTFEKTASDLGIGVHSETAGGSGITSSAMLPMSETARAAAELQVSHTYREFLKRVAAARHMTEEKVNEVAQGRVWTGNQALERGLADETGLFEDAAAEAAKLANAGSDYAVDYFDPEYKTGVADLLMSGVSARLPAWVSEALSVPAGVKNAEKASDRIQARSLWDVKL